MQGTLNASDDQYRVDGDELHNVGSHADDLTSCDGHIPNLYFFLYRSHLSAKSHLRMKRLLTYLSR